MADIAAQFRPGFRSANLTVPALWCVYLAGLAMLCISVGMSDDLPTAFRLLGVGLVFGAATHAVFRKI